MHNITTNPERVGNFTSSNAVKLIGDGKRKMTEDELAKRPKTGEGSKATLIEDAAILSQPALTYIKKRNMERRLGRSLEIETNARGLIWGKFLESLVFNLLGTDYEQTSSETVVHKEIPYWVGSRDGIRHSKPKKRVYDIKCPITLESYCNFADNADSIQKIRGVHEDGEKYYWQLVSNACINETDEAELIIYCPYKSELDAIREAASNFDGDQNKLAWINWAKDEDLPYLIDGGYYKNLIIIPFEIPQADKDYLKMKILKAGELLEDFKTPINIPIKL